MVFAKVRLVLPESFKKAPPLKRRLNFTQLKNEYEKNHFLFSSGTKLYSEGKLDCRVFDNSCNLFQFHTIGLLSSILLRL